MSKHGISFHVQPKAAKTIQGVTYQHLDAGRAVSAVPSTISRHFCNTWLDPGQPSPMTSPLNLRIRKPGKQMKLFLC